MRSSDTGARVVAYLRVSTDQQAAAAVSLDAQRRRCEAYASLYDLEIVEFVLDAGASAKSLEREALQFALGRLESGHAEGLLVAKLDRLTRSVADLGQLLDGVFSRHVLLSVAEQVDTRSAAGRLVLNILASVSQWEREAIGERTKAALATKKARGERVGTVPLGHAVEADGRTLATNPSEARALELVAELRAAGLSIRKIAHELNARGVPARGKKWHPTTVARVLSKLQPQETDHEDK
jgi:site-specific DNA recombinase